MFFLYFTKNNNGVNIRYFKLNGQYEGDWEIFDSREEFIEKKGNLPTFMWERESWKRCMEFETGMWIEASDGYIVPSLRKFYSEKKPLQMMIRVPMGTFFVYVKKNGTLGWQKLYAQYAQQDLYSLSHKQAIHRDPHINKKKVLFASLINQGLTPHVALRAAGAITNENNKTSINIQLMDWLTDEKVIQMIVKNNTFIDKIRNDEEFSDEVMIKYVKEYMNNVRLGSKNHLDSIPILLTLLGKTPVNVISTNNKFEGNISEASYNDIKPPLLEE